MNIRTLIDRLDEIDRRGFLKGLGAAGVAAATGIKLPAAAAASPIAPAVSAAAMAVDLGHWANTPFEPLIKSLLGAGFNFKSIVRSFNYSLDPSMMDSWEGVVTDEERTDLKTKLGPSWIYEIYNLTFDSDGNDAYPGADPITTIEKVLGRKTQHSFMQKHLLNHGMSIQDANEQDDEIERLADLEKDKVTTDKANRLADIEADRDRLIPDWGNVVETYQKISKRA